jgi:hypothetical protein
VPGRCVVTAGIGPGVADAPNWVFAAVLHLDHLEQR